MRTRMRLVEEVRATARWRRWLAAGTAVFRDVLVVPCGSWVPLPGVRVQVGVPEAASAVLERARGDEVRVAFMICRPGTFGSSIQEIYPVGVLTRVYQIKKQENQRSAEFSKVDAEGISRIRAVEAARNDPFSINAVEFEEVMDVDSSKDVAIRQLLSQHISELIALEHVNVDTLKLVLEQRNLLSMSQLADILASLCTCLKDSSKFQDIIEEKSVQNRVNIMLDVLNTEVMIWKTQQALKSSIQVGISESTKRFISNQVYNQYLSIKEILKVPPEPKEDLIIKLRHQIENLPIEQIHIQSLLEQLSRFSSLEPSSSDFNLIKSYLEFVLSLPWENFSDDSLEPEEAFKILNDDHFGMDDVKKTILQIIAVAKLRNDISGKILCFVGPPGVGKTSIGKSIARALNRKFYRFSVGGIEDYSEIKGHRRTYVGAMAGKFIQAIKLCKTSNPVILIDEIDKIQKSHRGDPSAALLEALDPSQNTSFLDHYLDIPFDLSKILFIVTANDLSTIPGPLRDRLEIIQLSGYLDEEKLEICKRYLVPKSIASCGLANKEVSITDSALLELIKNYCREPGVRALERHIDKIFRQVAYRIVSDSTVSPDKFTIDAANLEDFVGKPKFAISGYFEKHMVPGVVIGLAWSESGGKALYIESISSKRSGSSGGTLRTTGLMGDSMSESSSIAWTFCKAFVEKHKIKTKLFVSSDVHLHIPEGAVHKNGPSGGVAMVSSLLSLAMDTPVRSDTGMTGEITLNGIILGVGGLKEKCLAAKREGLKRVILPKPNESDILELPENIRKDLEFIFAETYEDVFASIFPSMPRLSTSRNSNISEA